MFDRSETDDLTRLAAFDLDDLGADEIDPCLRALRAIEDALGEDCEGTTLDEAGPGVPIDDGSLGRYREAVEIGRGGMGAILGAVDEQLGRSIAIKVLPRQRRTPEAVARFVREARITGQLEHPNIPPVHELVATDDGDLYFVMKRIDGRTLADALRSLAFPLEPSARREVLGALVKVCDALAYAHARGVVHRDVKPANVMLGSFGEVLLMDWGIARVGGVDDGQGVVEEAFDPDDDHRTLAGSVLGTPTYMAPEQAAGRSAEVDGRADVYSLGAVLFSALTLRQPPSAYRLEGDLPSPAESCPEADVPPELDAVVRRAMARSRADRYPDIGALQADLVAYLENRPLSVVDYGPAARLAKWIRRNPAVSGVAAAALVVLVVVSAAFVWRLDVRRREAEAAARRDGDLIRLRRLEERADALWPAVPSMAGSLEDWLLAARSLVARRDGYRSALGRVPAATDPEREAVRRTLNELTEGLDRLATVAIPDLDLRLAAARDVGRRMGEHEAAWAAAIVAIADRVRHPAYGGLVVAPMEGLVPLGPDPASGLWEFAHLPSGRIPVRGPDGILEVASADAIVLVLVPGGPFPMGAPEHGRDVWATPYERPVRTVDAGPFLIAKYEMTRAQWHRATGDRPGRWPDGERVGAVVLDDRHPVAAIDWHEASGVLARLGLELPTEVRWERAARAGTRTLFPAGDFPQHAMGRSNLADRTWFERWPDASTEFCDWRDGHVVHAPVGSFHPNPFGLHDVFGNVAEWCADLYGPYDPAAVDEAAGLYRVHRGGSWADDAPRARPAARGFAPPGLAVDRIGVRPARSLDPRR